HLNLRYSYTYRLNNHIASVSLHDALPIFHDTCTVRPFAEAMTSCGADGRCVSSETTVKSDTGLRVVLPAASSRSAYHSYSTPGTDRKSTRLNSSHVKISYAVFCLEKKTYS